jgi:hypothetical protein
MTTNIPLPTKDTFVHFSTRPSTSNRIRCNTMSHLEIEVQSGETASSDSMKTLYTPTVADATKEADDPAGPTTVMLRNIHNQYTPKQLLNDILKSGFTGKVDFFYMPVDTTSTCNLGYCFLNFRRNSHLSEFTQKFNGRQLPQFVTHKVLQVSVARIQGLKDNLDHLSNSAAVRTLPDDLKPCVFDNPQSEPVPYPPSSGAPMVMRFRRAHPKDVRDRGSSRYNRNE